MRLFNRGMSVIGLDIGRESIKAVQVSLHEKGPRLDGVVCVDRPCATDTLEPHEAELLVRAMQRQGLTASRVVLIAPTEALVGGSIALPPADSGASREKIVQMELSRTHKLTPGSFELAWWDLPAPASGARIGQAHALGLPHRAVEPTLDVLSQLGLNVARTVPGSLALLAAAQRYPIDPRCLAAVLDLGSTRGHLALMYAGRVIHERPLPDFNTSALRDQACSLLGVEDKIASQALGRYGLCDEPGGMVACQTTALVSEAIEPLAEEIGMSFAYVSHLYPEAELGHLLLSGGGANVPGLGRALSKILELQTVVISPQTLSNGECFDQGHDDPALTAAMGAALCWEGAK